MGALEIRVSVGTYAHARFTFVLRRTAVRVLYHSTDRTTHAIEVGFDSLLYSRDEKVIMRDVWAYGVEQFR